MLSWDVNNGVCTFYPSLKQLESSLLLPAFITTDSSQKKKKNQASDGCGL